MKIILLLFNLILVSVAVGQDIIINEFMSDNESTIADEDGDYSDWIELYNKSNDIINLEGFTLSDDEDDLNKWTFPAISLPPNGFLLIFASDKNRINSGELHANFKISAQGETLFLSNQEGILIDEYEEIPLSNNLSYGAFPDGHFNSQLLSIPTPGYSNNINNEVQMSRRGGFYKTPFYQKVSNQLADTIRYTFDGNLPTSDSNVFPDSLHLGYLYEKPNYFSEFQTSPEQSLIAYKAWESPKVLIDKAHILRYASFNNGVRTSKIYTQTYFIDSTIFEKYNLPVVSLITEENNLFDDTIGIYVDLCPRHSLQCQ